jgi:hypothetical protein
MRTPYFSTLAVLLLTAGGALADCTSEVNEAFAKLQLEGLP